MWMRAWLPLKFGCLSKRLSVILAQPASLKKFEDGLIFFLFTMNKENWDISCPLYYVSWPCLLLEQVGISLEIRLASSITIGEFRWDRGPLIGLVLGYLASCGFWYLMSSEDLLWHLGAFSNPSSPVIILKEVFLFYFFFLPFLFTG